MYKPSNKYHIRSFSIIEAIVGMVVAAIIMGVTFFIFAILTERMSDYKIQNQKIHDFNRLSFSLQKDAFESEKLDTENQNIQFTELTGNRINYQFLDSVIIRSKQDFIDTFYVKPIHYQIDSVKTPLEKKVYLKLSLNVITNEKENNLTIYKRVYANQLLNKTKE